MEFQNFVAFRKEMLDVIAAIFIQGFNDCKARLQKIMPYLELHNIPTGNTDEEVEILMDENWISSLEWWRGEVLDGRRSNQLIWPIWHSIDWNGMSILIFFSYFALLLPSSSSSSCLPYFFLLFARYCLKQSVGMRRWFHACILKFFWKENTVEDN